MTDDLDMRHMALIAEALSRHGLVIDLERGDRWQDGENGTEAVMGGKWHAVEDDDERGLYADGDDGVLSACVVGAPEFGNERVSITFTRATTPARGQRSIRARTLSRHERPV